MLWYNTCMNSAPEMSWWVWRLNILQPDTDGDGMNNGWENRYADIGFDPALDNSADVNLNNDPYADMDSDGLPNSEECGEIPHQFWFWDESTGSPIWTKKEKGDVSW